MSGSGPASSPIDCIAAGSSASASGLPAASRRTRSRVLVARSGAHCRSSASEAARSSGATRSSSSPVPTITSPRTANSATIGSAPSRRATNVSTSTVGASSNWASSATSTSGRVRGRIRQEFEGRERDAKGSAIPRPPVRTRRAGCPLDEAERVESGRSGVSTGADPRTAGAPRTARRASTEPSSTALCARSIDRREQRRLADTGVTTNDARAAGALRGSIEQVEQERQLEIATVKPRSPRIPAEPDSRFASGTRGAIPASTASASPRERTTGFVVPSPPGVSGLGVGITAWRIGRARRLASSVAASRRHYGRWRTPRSPIASTRSRRCWSSRTRTRTRRARTAGPPTRSGAPRRPWPTSSGPVACARCGGSARGSRRACASSSRRARSPSWRSSSASSQPDLVGLGRYLGLGAKRSVELARALGVRTADELREAAAAGRLRGVPGIGAEDGGAAA